MTLENTFQSLSHVNLEIIKHKPIELTNSRVNGDQGSLDDSNFVNWMDSYPTNPSFKINVIINTQTQVIYGNRLEHVTNPLK